MHTRKRLCALALVLCMTAGTVLAATQYSDVNEDDWYYEAVGYVSAQTIMSGISDVRFAPEGLVTRAMVAVVLWRLAGAPAPADGDTALFYDVAPDAWYASAVAWAQQADVASGYGTGAFGPGDNVTREQLAIFLWRYARLAGMELADGVLTIYEDEDAISAWALEGMKHAVGAGLIAGKTGNLLDPGGVATRGELAVILRRLMTPAAG